MPKTLIFSKISPFHHPIVLSSDQSNLHFHATGFISQPLLQLIYLNIYNLKNHNHGFKRHAKKTARTVMAISFGDEYLERIAAKKIYKFIKMKNVINGVDFNAFDHSFVVVVNTVEKGPFRIPMVLKVGISFGLSVGLYQTIPEFACEQIDMAKDGFLKDEPHIKFTGEVWDFYSESKEYSFITPKGRSAIERLLRLKVVRTFGMETPKDKIYHLLVKGSFEEFHTSMTASIWPTSIHDPFLTKWDRRTQLQSVRTPKERYLWHRLSLMGLDANLLAALQNIGIKYVGDFFLPKHSYYRKHLKGEFEDETEYNKQLRALKKRWKRQPLLEKAEKVFLADYVHTIFKPLETGN